MNARVRNFPWGMGDATWCIPALRHLHKTYEAVYIETPWPQMFEGFDWVRVLKPDSNSEYASWPMFRENMAQVKTWWAEPEDAEEIWFQETGDTSTRLRWFYDFPDEPADLSFPIRSRWVADAVIALSEFADSRLKCLLHVPGNKTGEPAHPRFCDPQKFAEICNSNKSVQYFDAQRIAPEEVEPIIDLPIRIVDTRHNVELLWGLIALADVIVTTDNHMLPLALAMGTEVMFLPGNVPVDYLLDPRIDRSKVTVIQ